MLSHTRSLAGSIIDTRESQFSEATGFKYPASQTPWQEIQRSMVDQLADGMVLRPAVKYQHIAQKSVPRDNH